MRIRRAWPVLGYVILFAALGFPWLRNAAHAVPFGNPFAFADDARFWVWLLGWVAHAMAIDPTTVLDANIHHPAPAELLASEHLASTQLLAAPAVWLTGNPILVANLLVLVSYPLGALAMRALLAALGCGGAVAWAGGLVFALGPLRVPGNLEVLHFLNPYLPLAALALHRLRDEPRATRALALGAIVTAGGLSGYYMAAMLALTLAAWGAVELARAAPGRGRFVAWAALAGGAATAVLVAVSLPYFGSPELAAGQGVGGFQPFRWSAQSLRAAATLVRLLFGVVPATLAAIGLAALATRDPVARRTAVAGLAVTLVGLAIVFPPAWLVAAIEASPLRFLRAQFRFAAVAGLGAACLAAAALELVRAHLGRSGADGAAIAVTALVILTHGPSLSGTRPDPLDRDRAVYETVAAVTHDDPGPLLTLPLVDAHPERRGGFLPLGQLESDDMIGSLVHWLPLVTGHTGYQPLHRDVLLDVLRALPDADALDELVDLTHVRWLLLRPSDYWTDPHLPERLLALPGVERAAERDGWRLARVTRPVRRPGWYEAIRGGYRSDRTVLGTPLEPLPDGTAAATMELVRAVPETVRPGSPVTLETRVRNVGTVPWPVVVPPGASGDLTVRLVASWHRGPAVAPTPLRRDVGPGDVITQTVRLRAPREPGDYALELSLQQLAGGRFASGGRGPYPLEVRLAVTDAPWALMVPPHAIDAGRVLSVEPDAPVERWERVEVHADAAACERARVARERLAGVDVVHGSVAGDEGTPIYERARCVAVGTGPSGDDAAKRTR